MESRGGPYPDSAAVRRVDELRPLLARTRAAAARLQSVPAADILARLERLLAAWRKPGSVWMEAAIQRVAAAGPFHPRMVAHALPFQLELLDPAAIRRLVESELGTLAALDEPHHAVRVVAHVMAGNIPGLAAVPMCLGVVAKQATVIKPAAGDPEFPRLFHASWQELDPELAETVAVVPWRGGDTGVEHIVLGEADVVVAMGSEAALAAIRQRVRGKFIGLGPRLSFAFVAADYLGSTHEAARCADALAYDVSVWDQRGCLSPQIVFVEKGRDVSLYQFAELLGTALERWAEELPGGTVSVPELAAIRTFRDEAQWQPGVRLVVPQGSLGWTVVVEPRAQFLPTCLGRTIRVQPVDSVAALVSLLAPHRHLLEGAGLAVPRRRWRRVAEQLRGAGVHWVTRLGTMQRPTLAWRPGGRDRIREWIQ